MSKPPQQRPTRNTKMKTTNDKDRLIRTTRKTQGTRKPDNKDNMHIRYWEDQEQQEHPGYHRHKGQGQIRITRTTGTTRT